MGSPVIARRCRRRSNLFFGKDCFASLAMTPSSWLGNREVILSLVLKGVFLCCQEVGRRMIPRRQGKIINFASIAGQIGLPGTIAYLCSKGGVVQLTRGLAVE